MMGEGERSDNELVAATRTGDRSVYAELWPRHSRTAIAGARLYTVGNRVGPMRTIVPAFR
ncbi:hypothetical protein [Agreia sp. VKM Ac-1783]|uniref:hypothetical protein n=1 Tax=Agreia sp. VKM Ac-1783 TaxID=1938889 RepID=UPI000A2ADA14|nr:hypothetical protein [Agreia sp. VKM Ac-1783]SMQ68476.1 hypothetical protein SAMN06295943_1881 [Agreia sp. VKM Ac-1783]